MDADEIAGVEREAAGRLDAAATLDELRAAEQEVTGKRSTLAGLNHRLKDLQPEERKARGQELHEARQRLLALAAKRREELGAGERRLRMAAERLDLSEVLPGRARRGHVSLVQQTRDELEDVFVGMGFAVAEGPEVETDWYNFEALNFPPGHPARSGFDTLYLNWGAPESTLIRPHTSPVQMRLMQAQPPPIYAVMPGRCYRQDTPDATHMPVFHQIEGLVIDKGITFAHLAGTIDAFSKAFFGGDFASRLRPAYFPFTEPSAEFEVTCAICEGSGCRTCSGTGWIELGGCGMVHPNVLAAGGIDAEELSGFAFGFGIDRLAQMRHGVPDMRVLLDNDTRSIRQF